MLSVLGRRQTVCSGLSRREVLRAGGAGLLGTSLTQLLAAEEAGEIVAPSAKSVLFLYLFGGPSQHESFDLKPDAPESIRGTFRPIASRTPGLQICEGLPRLAQMSDRFAVIRTLTHDQNDHNACHHIQTGRPFPPAERGAAKVNASDKDWPAFGSVLEYLDRKADLQKPVSQRRDFPSYVYVPNRCGHIQGYDRLGQYAGWLGPNYNALATTIAKRDKNDNPYFRDCTDGELDFRVQGLDSHADVTLDRLVRRTSLLDQFDAARAGIDRRGLDRSPSERDFDRVRERAMSLVTSEKMWAAFDVRRESPELRDRYGRHLFGQSALVGRRMIEAGARFVTVLWDAPDGYSWDSHRTATDVRGHLLPKLDQTFSALLDDMQGRGLLDETLIVCLGEIGRTPKLNGGGGRDHWSFCFPGVLAGGGIRGGVTYGRSDKDAAYPADHPVSPADLAATVFHALGIAPETRIYDSLGRPWPVVDGGQPLAELFG